MTSSQFITNETGKAISVDGVKANTGQCEQLLALFSQQVNGVSLPYTQGAVNLWDNPVVLALGYIQVSVSQLEADDMVIFGASSAINSPEFGHGDVYIFPLADGYIGFDSNWGGVVDTDPNSPTYGYPVAHQVKHNFVDVLGGLRFNSNMNPTAQQAHDTVMGFETEADGITPHQPTQADLDFGVSTPWAAYIPNFFAGVQKLRDTIQLLTNDRDTDLYPKINATCTTLGLPISATTDQIVAAIEALKNGNEPAATVLGQGNYRVN